jgi:beta-lactamase superfamily II metal-dependent hydrolase
MVFNINFLPAKYGDCIWMEYGNIRSIHRVLIDGGTGGTKLVLNELIQMLPKSERHFDLIVVTHVDRDHIEGILRLVEEDKLDFTVGDLWFNGWTHLPGNEDDESFGAIQGEKLTQRILFHKLSWNNAFGGKAIVIPHQGQLPVINLPGGIKLTLLSPLIESLANLKTKWCGEVLKAGLIPGFGAEEVKEEEDEIESFGEWTIDVESLNEIDFMEDTAEANASSIAFIAEYSGISVLFAGDSHPSKILDSLNKLYENKAPVTVMKLSHHGSSHNTSPELLEKLDCKKYVISTNGAIYKHPDNATIARVIKRGGNDTELIFNYKTQYTNVWESKNLQDQYNFRTVYPETEGVVVNLI